MNSAKVILHWWTAYWNKDWASYWNSCKNLSLTSRGRWNYGQFVFQVT